MALRSGTPGKSSIIDSNKKRHGVYMPPWPKRRSLQTSDPDPDIDRDPTIEANMWCKMVLADSLKGWDRPPDLIFRPDLVSCWFHSWFVLVSAAALRPNTAKRNHNETGTKQKEPKSGQKIPSGAGTNP